MSGRHYLTDCVLWETITFWHKHYFPCVSCFISAVFKLYFLTSHSWNASCSQFLSCQCRLYNVWPTLAVEHRRERFSIIPRPDVSLRLPSINVCSEYLCYLYTFFLVLPLVLCPGLSLLYGLVGNIVFHSHTMSKPLHLLSLDVLNTGHKTYLIYHVNILLNLATLMAFLKHFISHVVSFLHRLIFFMYMIIVL